MIYRCDNCEEWYDDDEQMSQPHPWGLRFRKYFLDVVCPDCYYVLEDEAAEVAREDALGGDDA